jgi:hypothetical protein
MIGVIIYIDGRRLAPEDFVWKDIDEFALWTKTVHREKPVRVHCDRPCSDPGAVVTSVCVGCCVHEIN